MNILESLIKLRDDVKIHFIVAFKTIIKNKQQWR